MQRADIRDRYHLRGNCATDIATACCCVLCDLVQQEKESEHREPLVSPGGAPQGYQMQGGMTYPAPTAAPTAAPAPSEPVQQEKAQEQEKPQEAGVTSA